MVKPFGVVLFITNAKGEILSITLEGNFYCFNKSILHRHSLPTIPVNRNSLQSRYNSENLGIVFID